MNEREAVIRQFRMQVGRSFRDRPRLASNNGQHSMFNVRVKEAWARAQNRAEPRSKKRARISSVGRCRYGLRDKR